ncbi:hypothetical protein [Bacillus sp. FJAT-49736]|uniref:hypothetical protein n=1 Tax=Bacillus sp. FJAT-49736 TaxID=2833582 RepID=UPI001BC8D24E|nr:hypothetical protein [Bacillus sp. FJAT-49736]MBS4174748.1 hypothetical protein [Bacillus sp. FJAT-49736]
MKKFLIEGAIYGFLIGLAIGLLFVKYKTITFDSGIYTTSYKPISEYIIILLRCGVIVSILGCLSGFVFFQRKK